ncbi:hypothetical protein FCM35_KLT17388 [Carex littledalei]|uniref:Uncharacterized protein n=1 Tax=Carex littledalei TaxID=544730 RepID=A0A833RG72_9POAL|nr:hypothetical protein FCM35_KLT17388 [Carex littledalei]
MRPLGTLRWYNFCFKEVFPGRIVNGLNQLENVLKIVRNDKTVTLVSLYGTRELLVRNLICHFENVGLRNYFFLGDYFELLSDLVRRGHLVIYGNHLLYGEISGTDFAKQTVVKGNLIRRFLELGYNIWLMDGNMAPVTNALPELSDQSFEFLARDDVELMFLRNSLNTRNVWNDLFVSKLDEKSSKSSEKENFVNLISKALEKSHLKMGTLDEWIVLVNLAKYNKDSTVKGRDTVVYWSGLSPVERELENVSLWLIDDRWNKWHCQRCTLSIQRAQARLRLAFHMMIEGTKFKKEKRAKPRGSSIDPEPPPGIKSHIYELDHDLDFFSVLA